MKALANKVRDAAVEFVAKQVDKLAALVRKLKSA